MKTSTFAFLALASLTACRWDQPAQIHYSNLYSEENPNAAPARSCTNLSCAQSVLTLTAPAPYFRTSDNQYGYIYEYLVAVPNAQNFDFATVDVLITPDMIESNIVEVSMTSFTPKCMSGYYTSGNYQFQTIYVYNESNGQIVAEGIDSVPSFQPVPGVAYRVRGIVPQVDENAGDCHQFQFVYTLFMSTQSAI